MRISSNGVAFKLEKLHEGMVDKPKINFTDQAYACRNIQSGNMFISQKQVLDKLIEIRVNLHKQKAILQDTDQLEFQVFMKGIKTGNLKFSLAQAADLTGLPKELILENAEFILNDVIQVNEDGTIWLRQVPPLPPQEVLKICENKFLKFRKSNRYQDMEQREIEIESRVLARGCECLDGAMYKIIAYKEAKSPKIEAWSLVSDEILRLDLPFERVLQEEEWQNIFSSLFIDKNRGRILCINKKMMKA